MCLTPYVRSECCFDKDVAFDGGTLVLKLTMDGDNYWRPLYDRICQDYQVCLASDFPYRCEDYRLGEVEKDGISYCKGTCQSIDTINGVEDYYCNPQNCLPPGDTSANQPPDIRFCPSDALSKIYCNNLQERVGSFCSVGKCNMFGCDCDGGCIERSGRKLSVATENATRSGEGGIVGKCQQAMIDKFNTFSLKGSQVREYFDCLDSNTDDYLDAQDETHKYVMNLTYGSERLAAMDADGNGIIDASEFDSDLSDGAPTETGAGIINTCTMLLGLVIVVVGLSF